MTLQLQRSVHLFARGLIRTPRAAARGDELREQRLRLILLGHMLGRAVEIIDFSKSTLEQTFNEIRS